MIFAYRNSCSIVGNSIFKYQFPSQTTTFLQEVQNPNRLQVKSQRHRIPLAHKTSSLIKPLVFLVWHLCQSNRLPKMISHYTFNYTSIIIHWSCASFHVWTIYISFLITAHITFPFHVSLQDAFYIWASLIAQLVKNPPAMQETPVR